MRFANRGESLDDLIQVGTVGLIKAIDRFDTEPRRRVHDVRHADDHRRDQAPLPRQGLGGARCRAVFRSSISRSTARSRTSSLELGRSATVSDLAARLGATDEEIIEAQELGQAYNLLSLDTELAADGEAQAATLLDYVGRDDARLALLEDKANLGARVRSARPARTHHHLPALLREPVADRRSPNASTSRRCTCRACKQRALAKLKHFFKEVDAKGRRAVPPVRSTAAYDVSAKSVGRSSTSSSSKGHRHLPGASLVPDAMSTTLFTIAGMEPFVPVFLGDEPAPAPRVGHRAALPARRGRQERHRKRRPQRASRHVPRDARQFLVRRLLQTRSDRVGRGSISPTTLGIPAERLYATVYVDDDEAAEIWRRDIGLAAGAHLALARRQFLGYGSDRPVRSLLGDLLRPRAQRSAAGSPTAPSAARIAIATSSSGTSSSSSTIAMLGGDAASAAEASASTPAWASSACAWSLAGKTSIFDTDLYQDIIARAAAGHGESTLSPRRARRAPAHHRRPRARRASS